MEKINEGEGNATENRASSYKGDHTAKINDFLFVARCESGYSVNVSQKEMMSSLITSRLERIHREASDRRALSLGYPVNQKFDYTELFPFINMHLNNAGDPYLADSTLLNSRDFEQEVLEYFSRLWNAKSRTPLLAESYWGYILAMGATEGNMYALWSAREYFHEKMNIGLLNNKVINNPLLYFSHESHYSIIKCAKILGITTFQDAGNQFYPGQCPVTADGYWPSGVPVDEYGAVDEILLKDVVDFFAQKGHPPIIVLNIGSTFQGAFDNPSEVWHAISPVLEKYGFSVQTKAGSRPDCWIHIDGALGAAYLPYLEMANHNSGKVPCFDFRLPWINSIVMSSHKWYGAPFASGIYMSNEKYRMNAVTEPEYIDSPDTTLCGSRNGLSALILWYAITTVTPAMQSAIAKSCEALAAYACEKMKALMDNRPSFLVMRGPHSLVVTFSRPKDEVFSKFQLSGRGEFAHIVIMPHVTRDAIDQLVNELSEDESFKLI